MIQDLQRIAQRIGVRLGGVGTAMQIHQKATDRRRGMQAIIGQLRPVAVAQLGDVHHESLQQMTGVIDGNAGFRRAYSVVMREAGDLIAIVIIQQRLIHRRQKAGFFFRRQVGIVGDIGGRPHTQIKAVNVRAQRGGNEPAGHGKILIVAGFSGLFQAWLRFPDIDVTIH